MTSADEHPWCSVTTRSRLPADQVISALQKEIRRGHTRNAACLAYEMATTSPELERYLWQRLMVISVEDIGLAVPQAPVLVTALRDVVGTLAPDAGDRALLAVHAVRYLCGCEKDRASDEMLTWIAHGFRTGKLVPEIPDYALDVHTDAGRRKGRGVRHFWTEGTRLQPEWEARDRVWRERIQALLDDGSLADE